MRLLANWRNSRGLVILIAVVVIGIVVAGVSGTFSQEKSRISATKMNIVKPVRPPGPGPTPDPQKAFVPCNQPPGNQSMGECDKLCKVMANIHGGTWTTVDTAVWNPDGTPGQYNWLNGTNYQWGCYNPHIRW
jgi:hypothetical protein